jgi:hypothetical protein
MLGPFTACACGLIIGVMCGFVITGHRDAQAGVSLRVPILKFLFRPTAGMASWEIAILLVLSGCWFIVIVALIAAPIWLIDGNGRLVMGVLFFSQCFGFWVGLKLFRRMNSLIDPPNGRSEQFVDDNPS